MDAATTSLAGPDLRGRLLKAAVVVPDLIISGLINLVILAALPPDAAACYVGGMLAISLVLASGRAEGPMVRLLCAARRPTRTEAMRLAGPLRLVADRTGDHVGLLVGRSGGMVTAAGRRQVILRREIVDAYRAGRITDREVAALIVHGLGRLRHGRTRFDLLWAFWTAPWDFIRGLVAGAGRHLAWIPLGRFAWQTRFVVGTLAVVLEAQAGRWPSPIIIATFIALSYLMPLGRRSWEEHLTDAADHHAAQLGFAGSLSRFLRRLPRDADLADRLDRLTEACRTPLRPSVPATTRSAS